MNNDSDSIAIIWHIDDVSEVRPDLTEDERRNVLQHLKSEHDATIGVNWDVIEAWADYLYPKKGE